MARFLCPKITNIVNDWLEYLAIQKNYSKNTLSSYLNDLKNYLLFLNHYHSKKITLDDISYSDVRCIRSWLSSRSVDKFSFTSTARALSSVKNFYKYLEKKYNINCNSIFTIQNPKKNHSLPKALDKDEVRISLKNIEILGNEKWIQYRNKALLTLIYASGLRISEALSLTKQHLDSKQFLRIVGKGNKERIIPWISKSKKLITEYLQLLPYTIKENEPVFRGKRGLPLQRSVFHKELTMLRRTMGLPKNLSSHTFRHSFATHLLENGANLRSIQELLGHSTLSTTQKYIKINSSYLESVYSKTHPDAKKDI